MAVRLTVSRDTLADALSVAERAAAARDTLPVLSGVRLVAAEGQLRVCATDLEVGAWLQVPAAVVSPGDRVVEAKLLTALVRRLPGPDVVLYLADDGATVEVQCGSARFSLRSVGSEEFPELPVVSQGWEVHLPGQQLADAVRQTLFCAAPAEQRPVLSGVLVELEGQLLKWVATDGSRLAYREVPLQGPPKALGGAEGSPRVILPARAVAEMERLAQGAGENPVILRLGERLASLEVGEGAVVLTTRLIEGTFPPYRQVFLEDLPTRVRFDRKQMLEAVQRAALLSRRGPAVVFLDIGPEGIRVRAGEADVGQGEEMVAAELEGPGVSTAYQARFLEDLLRAVGAQALELHIGDPGRQGTVRIPGDPGYRYVVMPVRVE